VKLKATEYGSSDHFSPDCRAPRCRRLAITTGDGFHLPFCKRHTEQLTRSLFHTLSALSQLSLYHPPAVKSAEAAVERALRHLSKPPKGSRRC
jgi:hypothetical protein